MIQVSNLTKSYSGVSLFEGASFTVSPRERIGFVGRNGAGKSTLMKIVMGRETPDRGEVNYPKGYRIGYLDQHISFTKPTLLEECIQALPEENCYD